MQTSLLFQVIPHSQRNFC